MGRINPEYGLKVRLRTDLTRYNKGLVPGVEGVTAGRQGMWSHVQDRFITVRFEGIATLDVLWSSLEIIDEDYLKQVEEDEKKFKEELKTARNVKIVFGPKGGFRYLDLEYDSDGHQWHRSIGSKSEADEVVQVLKGYGIPVQVEKQEK